MFVPRYVVRDLLGQGTFGQVFKCVCADTDGEESSAIAIKVGPLACGQWAAAACAGTEIAWSTRHSCMAILGARVSVLC